MAAVCFSCPGDFDVDGRRLCFAVNTLFSSFALGLDRKLELFQLVFLLFAPCLACYVATPTWLLTLARLGG